MFKFLKLKNLWVTVALFICLVSNLYAQDTTPEVEDALRRVDTSRAVIDERCAREKLMDPGGLYAKFCEIENNKETYIMCLNKAIPEEKSFFGRFFDLFHSGIRITPDTFPYVIRTVMIAAFAVLGVAALWMAIWGYYKWTAALNDSPDEASKLWKYFTNGLWGLLFSLGSLVLTWGIFYAAGVRRGNFFDIGTEISGYLSFPCRSLDVGGCFQYDYSCKYNVAHQGQKCVENEDAYKNDILKGLPNSIIEPNNVHDNPCLRN